MSLFTTNRFGNLPKAANDPTPSATEISANNLENLICAISPFLTTEEYRRLYEIERQKGHRHVHHEYNDTFSVRSESFEPNPLIHAAVRDNYLANHDSLTGLFSKGALEQELFQRKELLDSREDHLEKDSRFWICMIDIDFFKIVNDTHGHSAGDSVLRAVAQTLRLIVREHDFLARYGGEEFTLLVKGSASDIFSLAERMRSEIERNPIIITNEENQSTLRIPITISIGISYCDENPDATLEEADAALYLVKGKRQETGRNHLRTARVIRDNEGRKRNQLCYYAKRENIFIFNPHLS